MSDQTAQPTAQPQGQGDTHATDNMWRILIHNDDQTPFEYVIYTLNSVFMLSEELAEHVASTAHTDGSAVVVARPHAEAAKLMNVALGRAKTDGYPLKFTLEQN